MTLAEFKKIIKEEKLECIHEDPLSNMLDDCEKIGYCYDFSMKKWIIYISEGRGTYKILNEYENDTDLYDFYIQLLRGKKVSGKI